jgi:hypothetical protein
MIVHRLGLQQCEANHDIENMPLAGGSYLLAPIEEMTLASLLSARVLMRLYSGSVLRCQFEKPKMRIRQYTEATPKFRYQFRFKAAFTPSACGRTGGHGRQTPFRALTVQRLQSPAMAAGGASSAEGRAPERCINRLIEIALAQTRG